MINIVLYQPDIPQNTGAFVRLCACLGLHLHIVEPCGFVLDDKKLARVAMDYTEKAHITRHTSWEAFRKNCPDARVILLTTKAATPYIEIEYRANDYLLLGRESSGVPQEIHDAADVRVTIPMQEGARSLNVVLAAGMVAGEALRQTEWI